MPFLKSAVPEIGGETITSAADMGGITRARHVALVVVNEDSVELGDVGFVTAVYLRTVVNPCRGV